MPRLKRLGLSKNLYFSLIAQKRQISIFRITSLSIYILWVPHERLQLVCNPQCDTRHGRVVHSGGSSQQNPWSPTCPLRSCLTDSTAFGVTRFIQFERARSVPNVFDVRDSMI